jgi:hypothetical protein
MTLCVRSRRALMCYVMLLMLAPGKMRADALEKTSPLRVKSDDPISRTPSLNLTDAVTSQPDTCASGSMCIVTLGNTSYAIEGPCDIASVSAIPNCHVILAMPKGTINDARLAMLPLMLLCWAIAWSLRYVPFPIKNPLLRVPIQLIYAFGFGVSGVAQINVFRLRAGIRGELFRNDNLSFIIVLVAGLIGLWLVFNSIAVQRKKQQCRNAIGKG